jgi:hypothetical protein
MSYVHAVLRWVSIPTGGVFVAIGLIVGADAWAFRMVPMNLEEMAAQAQRIVVGVCTAREEGEVPVSPGGPSVGFTQYTFRVTDYLKGNPGPTLTVRQVRLGRRPTSNGLEQPVARNPLPLPEYQPGQEVLLFLGDESPLGLTSPVAMEQAVFDVEMSGGQRMLRHRFANRSLFRNMSASHLAVSKNLSPPEIALFPVKENEPIPYAPFMSLVRKLMNGN